MANKRTLLTVLVIVLAVAMMSLGLIGCKKDPGGDQGSGNKYTVTWNVDANLTVTVDGYDKLPDKVNENDTLTFAVEGKDASYTVDTVTVDGSKLTANRTSKKYVTKKIVKDTTITITAKESIKVN